MPFDEGLAERIREAMADERAVGEKRMFGGICFLRDGKMFAGVSADELMVRVGPDAFAGAIAEPHVRPMVFRSRADMAFRGFVLVAPEAIDFDDDLQRWLRRGLAFADTLPAKATKATPKPKSVKAEPRAPKPKARANEPKPKARAKKR